ncbi:glycosyltransferase [Emcibacter sp. SYSU 3D8]|uniref:glycosyltransferase n=1 Tax=Emcibacter sp. SYSU 3D8 TaxID=3133969 RepID=UPI0031FECA7E
MPTRLALHHFESDPNLEQRDGVNLAHTEINRLLEATPHPGLDTRFHDFPRLLGDPDYARDTLENADCVLANVGPHAHYYHYLRDRLGLDFRIVRDIKTGLWSSYLLQEALCAPYLRPGDALLATSNYSRVLTRHLFPHLRGRSIYLFEPVLAAPCQRHPAAVDCPRSGDVVTLGYVGRLSEDKNFPQVVDLLVALDRQESGKYRLVACGAVHSASCDPEAIAARIAAETGRTDLFEYLPPIAYDQVIGIMRRFDYLLFFSTSNLEVLGRVLIEAAHAAVPVLAADHAAASELLAPSSLLDVTYELDRPFYAHFDAPMGHIDIGKAASRIRGREVPDAPPVPQVNRLDGFIDVLRNRREPESDLGLASLNPAQQQFVGRLRWEGLTRYGSTQDAGVVIEEMLEWFCALNGKGAADFHARLEQLEALSRFKERTRRFMAASSRTRCDFTNLGGIDIELCNVAGYHPRFRLSD